MNFNENSRYLITGEPAFEAQLFLHQLKLSLQNGIKLVQIRAKSLDKLAYTELAKEAVILCHQFQALALLHTHIDLLKETSADGIHLPSLELMKLKQRPVSSRILFSASCHDEEQVCQASNMSADFIVISPVLATSTCPESQPLGWEKFSLLASLSKVPVYALGGMKKDSIEQAQSYGAAGIAGISCFWGW